MLSSKREKVLKKDKTHFPIIWIERILLLQVYLSSHFIAKQGTIFKYISTLFSYSSSGLIYDGPANWSFRRPRTCANYYLLGIFFVFFPESIYPKNYFLLPFVLFNQASTKSLWTCKMCLFKKNRTLGMKLQSFIPTKVVKITKLIKEVL